MIQLRVVLMSVYVSDSEEKWESGVMWPSTQYIAREAICATFDITNTGSSFCKCDAGHDECGAMTMTLHGTPLLMSITIFRTYSFPYDLLFRMHI